MQHGLVSNPRSLNPDSTAFTISTYHDLSQIIITFSFADAASKHAFQAFYDTLRAEIAGDNINVIVISPGYIRTNLSHNAVCADGSQYGGM